MGKSGGSGSRGVGESGTRRSCYGSKWVGNGNDKDRNDVGSEMNGIGQCANMHWSNMCGCVRVCPSSLERTQVGWVNDKGEGAQPW